MAIERRLHDNLRTCRESGERDFEIGIHSFPSIDSEQSKVTFCLPIENDCRN